MKKKVLFFNIILTILLAVVSSNVYAEGYGPDPELQFPSLAEIEDEIKSGISSYANMNGYEYSAIYGIDFAFRYSWNNGSYGYKRNWNEGMPTSVPSNPFPFDVKQTDKPEAMFVLALSSNASSLNKRYAIAYTAGYCVGWGVPFGEYEVDNSLTSTKMKEYDYHQLKKNRNGDRLTDENIRAVKYVLTYGYNYPIVSAAEINNAVGSSRTSVVDGIHYYGSETVKDSQPNAMATQFLCWVAANGYIEDDAKSKIIEDYFFENSWSGNNKIKTDGVPQIYYSYKSNIVKAMKMPSYSSSSSNESLNKKIELGWNEANQRFETNVKDTYAMNQASKVYISYEGQDSSLHFEQNSDGSVTIWTKSVVGSKESPNTFKVVKTISDAKDAIITAKASDTDHQPIAVPKEGIIREENYISVYTQALKIKVHKVLNDVNGCYGDATTKDCEFTIYEDEECTKQVAKIVVDENGNSPKTKYLPYKTYYAIETKNNASTKPNINKYVIDPTKAALDGDGDLVYTFEASNDIVLTSLRMIKSRQNGDNTENSPAYGAVLRLTLQSNPNETYAVTINKTGFAEFSNIPYGIYTLSEDDAASDVHLEIDEKTIELTTSNEIKIYKTIIQDKNFTTFVKVVKIDAKTNSEIKLAGAKFKIYDTDKKEFVKFVLSPSGETDTLVTNEDGYFITPQTLYGGNYVLYEVEAPKGYYLDPKYTIPENEKDLGDVTKGGIELNLTKLLEVEETDDDKLIYTMKVKEEPLMGKIEVEKTGEMLVGYTEKVKEANNGEEYVITEPRYEEKGLKGVQYTITAKEDIKSPDGTQTYVAKGKQYIIETDENGYAISQDLYLGTYEITETKTPLGYVTDKNIPDITLENNDQTKRIEVSNKKMFNPKQKTEINIEKILETTKFKYDKINVVLGLYTDQEFKTYDGKYTVMRKDTLVDVVYGEVEAGKTLNLKSNVNLPAGKYYFKELDVDYPYSISQDKTEVIVSHKNTNDETLYIDGISITNIIDSVAEFGIIKLSATDLVLKENQPLVGGRLTDEQIDQNRSAMLQWLKVQEPSKIKEVLTSDIETEDEDDRYMYILSHTAMKSGAVYEIYKDKDCTEALKYEDGKIVTIETNKKGFGSIEELPLGEYWLKEIKAPVIMVGTKEVTADIDKNPKQVILTLDNKDQLLYTIYVDTVPLSKFTKRDIFTSELVPNCTFVIKDKDGNEIVQATTDENGKYELYLDWFKEGDTYTYTEIEAPDIYELNTEPHVFKVEFDEKGNFTPIEITNTRKTREVIVRKVDSETGDPLEGCVFTIALINEKTGEQIYDALTGEPVYLVENATTNENGEFVIEKAPMGTYKFTEIKAPEGYELDEDLTGLVFTINNDSPETIIFEVTNTGDIPVVAIAFISLVCVVGIVFVIMKNRKQRV